MNHVATWFEIPVTDMQRAKNFYENVMETSLKDDEMNGHQMAIFAADEGVVGGMLMSGEYNQPSQTGTIVYLNGGNDLNARLEKVIAQGGAIILPKTPIHEGEHGYFAMFLDSEGNRIGLYSPA